MRRRILVVEDDRTLRQTLSYNLNREGYDVTTAADGEAALEAARNSAIDLILLDVMLPGMSGVEVLRVLRRDGISAPVIIVSAKGDEIDRVVGLKVGADDYVTKPFSRPELLARIEALLRRQRSEPIGDEPSERIQLGEIRVDVGRRLVTIGERSLHLTTKEFDLLWILLRDAGKVVTREQIMREVWDAKWWTSTKTLDMHISWLRRKLGDDAHSPRYITTVRGVGFRFERGD